ncbi:MAG: valine--tRNA ligase [Planctomycetes bacterium]|nr:valine--tRNA ligase [Planctomycetota bacterium]
METAYNPKTVEDRIYKFWEEHGYFSSSPNKPKKPFSIVIPPPNVTGILHMGHVMDETPQDILVRFKRMQGFETCWVPGTDHAGIATQNAVEKELKKNKSSRHALGRTKFVERVWEWKKQYGDTIIQQLKKLGCSCDWSRLRFTMDEAYSAAVKDVFVRLYEKGLIYRGNYIVNWCPRCLTALSDEEVENVDTTGGLYWIRYAFKDNPDKFVVVATTRPETMLGDTAVAVNPTDPRYKNLIGQTLIMPIMNREIKIIADEIVEKDFGSGAVKVTPAHDPNDFMMGQKHNLESINILAPDGKMSENAGEYKGLDRLECRKRIVQRLTDEGLLEKQEKYQHAVGHCYRCNTMIEPYLSLQWFVKMKPLAEPAIKAVRSGDVKFFPEHWSKTYLNWMENIRDWCVSRQLWWGHRLPVWYCAKCHPELNIHLDPPFEELKEGKSIPPSHFDISSGSINNLSDITPIVSKEKTKCPKCGSRDSMVQDPDVLDTWFSSWLWPFTVFGWPKQTEDLKYFYPTSVLNSGKDIIFFWVSRMIMAGIEFTGKPPFKDVYIHGIARDNSGRKLSKSLGNSPDPLVLIDQYSADALRFGIMANIPLGGDINLSDETYESGRNFCNKLWNASRLVLTSADASGVMSPASKTQDTQPTTHDTFEDRWILSRLNTTIRDYTKALETYQFSEAAHLIYHFFWSDLCDWYLEIIKPRLYSQDASTLNATRSTLFYLFSNTLRMLHPFIPFITEELWQKFKEQYPEHFQSESVMSATWPSAEPKQIDEQIEQTMEINIGIIRSVRNIRNKMTIERKQALDLIISAEVSKALDGIRPHEELIKHQANLGKIEMGVKLAKPKHSATEIVNALQLFIPLEGIIDPEAEKKRLEQRLIKIKEQLALVTNKLSDENFKSRAPQAILQKELLRQEELAKQEANLKESLREL